MAEKVPIYCHQCHRYKNNVFCCTNVKKDKLCIMKYCQKCIARSYPREEAESAQLDNWVCPRCREMCNCCACRRKKGLLPIGKKRTNIDQILRSGIHYQIYAVSPKGEDESVIEEYCSSKRIWQGILNLALERIPNGILQNHVADFNKQEEPEVSMQDHDKMKDGDSL